MIDIRASLGAGAKSVPDDELDAYLAHLITQETAAKKLNKKVVDYGDFKYTSSEKPTPTRCKPDVRFLKNLIRHTEPPPISSSDGKKVTSTSSSATSSSSISIKTATILPSSATTTSSPLIRKGRHFLTSQHSGVKGSTILSTVFNDTPAGKKKRPKESTKIKMKKEKKS
ncbi:hypothetical protein HMI54_004217 [Coelomomyces lativittatus]|nr:hypothetical protein HMI54_004217 [Coelomomyces lativittatus]KAJ1510539.1 hypothetical protein HMI56_006289 [Coelomomyces lativittatus]